MTRLVVALLPLTLAACGGGDDAQNNQGAATPEVTGDLNMAIGGDEISPLPEGEDLVGSNAAGGNLAAPPPAAAPDVANNAVAREP